MGPQILTGAKSSTNFQWNQSLLQAFTCLAWSSPRAAGGSFFQCGHPWTKEGLPTHHGLQEKLFSSVWSTSSLTFFNDLGVCTVVPFTYFHSSLSCSCWCEATFPLLKPLATEAPLLLVGLGQWWVWHGAGLHWLCWTWRMSQPLTEATPGLPWTKTCPCKFGTERWASGKTFWHFLVLLFCITEIYCVTDLEIYFYF